MVQSRTGTGKTAAFGIPMVERIDTSVEAVQAVVLAPTRELAIQVAEEITQLGRAKGVKVVSIYGGDSMDRQLDEHPAAARRSWRGRPGRVLDHLRRRTMKFDAVKMLVLDEADRMLDMGFAVGDGPDHGVHAAGGAADPALLGHHPARASAGSSTTTCPSPSGCCSPRTRSTSRRSSTSTA